MDEVHRLGGANGAKSAFTDIGEGLVADALPCEPSEKAFCFELEGGKATKAIGFWGGNGGNGKEGNGHDEKHKGIAEKWIVEKKGRSVLSIMDPTPLGSAERLAFRINAYNYKLGIRGVMPEDLMDFVVRKKEEHYIDKFKNQNALMKKFGEDGIKVYVVLDENKSMGQMLHESGVGEDKFVEILDFMDREGMIKLEHAMPETALLKPPVPKGEGAKAQPKQAAYEPPAEKAKPAMKEPAVAQRPTGISSKIQITQQTEGDEEVPPAPPEMEQKPKTPPVPGIMRDEHTSTPLPPEYHKEKVLQPPSEEPAPPPPRPRAQIEIRQAGEEIDKPSVEPDAPRPEDLLSPLEKIIYGRFGREGVEVYNLIDGEKTAEEILRETGISETKLVEILEFMDDEGIIKLEKPGKKRGKEEIIKDRKEVQFEPILDDKESLEYEPVPLEERTKNVPLALPVQQKVGLFTSLETKLKLTLSYRGKGKRLLSAVDGKKDTVALAKELGMNLEEVDKVLGTLVKRNVISVGPLTDSDIKERYGVDGLKIFKRYGRDGVLIYDLIGKEKTIKDLIKRSGIEPKRAVGIVLFIHKLLGLGVSINKSMLYRQLGIKEEAS
ncbi:MAG: hypothetical protein ABIF01_01415 [Candidatus Micrarchaeota archaeon]